MKIFSNECVYIATADDVSSLLVLLNQAYRGENSRQGWTTEAHLIAGDVRTTKDELNKTMELPGSVILKYETGEHEIVGCVNLQKRNDKIYLGMFAVSPHLQGGGIGKQLLHAAEEYAQHLQYHLIYMTVISLRTELINWYIRHGYKDTGKRKPFEEDGISGKHIQLLDFAVLEKEI